MRLYVLGFGGWISSPYWGYTSILIEAKCGKRALFDVGEGIYERLKMCGFDVSAIDYIFITHKHGDHLLGLPTLMLYASSIGKRLVIYAPADIDPHGLLDLCGIPHCKPYVEVRKFEYSDRPVLIMDDECIRVYAAKADHAVNSVAYRIEADGQCVVYTGDTRPSSAIAELSHGCDLLIHEASCRPEYADECRRRGHSTIDDAIEMALKAGVKALMPIHFHKRPLIIGDTKGVRIVLPLPLMPIDLHDVI